MRRHPRLVSFLWRWHRRVGLLAALLAVLLAVTGIALNHTAGLGLDRRFIDWPWLHRLYGSEVSIPRAYQVDGHWLYRSNAGVVLVDGAELAPCRGELVGALAAGELLLAACAEELLLATRAGELVESIGTVAGLPAPLAGVGMAGAQPLLHSGGAWWHMDLDRLEFDQPAPPGALIHQLTPGTLPGELQAALPRDGHWLSLERLLLDIHSGRLGGRAGVWLVDAAGLMFCLLGVSGVAMWWLHRRGGATRFRSGSR